MFYFVKSFLFYVSSLAFTQASWVPPRDAAHFTFLFLSSGIHTIHSKIWSSILFSNALRKRAYPFSFYPICTFPRFTMFLIREGSSRFAFHFAFISFENRLCTLGLGSVTSQLITVDYAAKMYTFLTFLTFLLPRKRVA